MKLKFVGMNLEFPITNTPSIVCSPDACTVYNARFYLTGKLEVPEGTDPEKFLHGHFLLISDSEDFILREFDVEDFNHYELTQSGSEEEPSMTLYFTTSERQPIVEPDPPVLPTEEELLINARAEKQKEIQDILDPTVAMGIVVETENGDERFSLNEKDKTMLLSIYAMVQSGLTSYPYHSINSMSTNHSAMSTNICTVYSDQDIAKIATAAFAFITFHESYANMLNQWIMREEDRSVINNIHYGVELPEDLQMYLMMIITSAVPGDDEAAMMTMMPKNMPLSGSQIDLPLDYKAHWFPPKPRTEPEYNEAGILVWSPWVDENGNYLPSNPNIVELPDNSADDSVEDTPPAEPTGETPEAPAPVPTGT